MVSVFLPTIIGTLGYESIRVNLMTVPVYATAYVCLLITAFTSDRFKRRGLAISLGGSISGVGFICLGTLKNESARYGMCFLAVTVRLCSLRSVRYRK